VPETRDPPDPATDALSSEERRAVARHLAKAQRGIDAMRTFFWTCAVAGVLWALLASGWWSAVGGAVAVVNVAGALQVRKQPSLWAIVVAAVLVPVGLALLVAAILEVEIRVALGALVLVLGPLYSIRTMRRAERLLAEFPDHYSARRMTGTSRTKRR